MSSVPAAQVAAFRAIVSRHAQEWSIPCGRAELDALEAYSRLLFTWTARINLTGATSFEDLATEHLPDAFALAARLLPSPQPLSAVDVGSGGGLPALPLAILCPALSIRLMEPMAKKAAFLRTAIRELGLAERLHVDGRRGETLTPNQFDVALSRATLPPPAWMTLAARLVRPQGRIFVLASTESEPELPPPPLTPAARISYLNNRRVLLELLRST